MISTTEAQQVLDAGGKVVDEQGNAIGKVGQVFLDDGSSEPAWVTAKTGLFGGAESFVPLEQASLKGHDVVVPFDKATVKDAPRVQDADSHLEPHEEDELYRYYGMGGRPDGDAPSSTTPAPGQGAGHDTSVAQPAPTPAPTSAPAPATSVESGAITRTVEEIDPGATSPTPGRRLRRYVVTEEVPVSTPTGQTTATGTTTGTDGTVR